jgi:taurine--2-oxoglutarate transaminase
VIAGGAIARHFDDHLLSCGLTAYAHPLTCAAIVAAIGAYRDEGLIPRAARLGEALGLRLRSFAENRPAVRQVRGVGLLWALELGAPDAETAGRMKRLAQQLRDRHIHLHKRDNLLFLAPPLVIEEADLEAGLVAVGEAIDAAWER